MVKLETTDIFRGAFLLCNGGDLTEVRVRKSGRRIATFLITGKNLDQLDRDYRSGRALVNPVQLCGKSLRSARLISALIKTWPGGMLPAVK